MRARRYRPVYDGLVAYRAAGGLDSLTLVPDLAETLPVPSADGLTYTFFLRPNIHYSNGNTVVADDFRRGVERALVVGDPDGRPDWFYRIVGGQACHDHPASCDLHNGVDTNDAARRVTFHLTRADPEFLYRLATNLVVPTPPGIPLTTQTRTPLPGTGPYCIAGLTPKTSPPDSQPILPPTPALVVRRPAAGVPGKDPLEVGALHQSRRTRRARRTR